MVIESCGDVVVSVVTSALDSNVDVSPEVVINDESDLDSVDVKVDGLLIVVESSSIGNALSDCVFPS